MPQVIPFAVAYAASNAAAAIGASVATQATIAATAATVAASVQTTAVLIGASYVLAKLTAPPVPKPSDGQIELKQAIPPRFFTYGGFRTNGPILLFEVADAGHDLLKIVGWGTRPIGAIQKFYIDGHERALDGTGGIPEEEFRFVDDDTHGFLHTHLGAEDQAADAALLEWVGWSTNHRLRGIPYGFERLYSQDAEDFQEAFPNGPPTMEIVAGVNVYDPRKDSTNGGTGSHRRGYENRHTWEYSDNQRLCALDWLTWRDGYNKSFDRIDWPSWIEQIALADENVPLKVGGGATEKRYRIATRVGYDEPRSRVLHRILQAGDQQLYVTRDGLIASRGGKWDAPTVGLEVEQFPEMSFTHGVPMMERCNEFELTCMLPERDYGEFELEPWVNAADPEHIAGIIRRQPLDLSMVPSNGQARRLAKIYMSKRNPAWSGQVRTSFRGLDVLGEDKVSLAFSELDQPAGTFNGPFWINGQIAFLPDKTGLTMAVSAADPTAYDWNPATEELEPPEAPGVNEDAAIELAPDVVDEDEVTAFDEDESVARDEVDT